MNGHVRPDEGSDSGSEESDESNEDGTPGAVYTKQTQSKTHPNWYSGIASI